MRTLPPQRYFDALTATWAPLNVNAHGAFLIQSGGGGGKRVSAATLNSETVEQSDILSASEAMQSLGQNSLFMLRPEEAEFDLQLAELDYQIIDPTVIYACPSEDLARHASGGLSVIPGDIPLAAQKEIWATDNIGPARISVMERSSDPKGFLMGRHDDKIAGTAFVSSDDTIAMLHALTVSEHARRKGVGKNLTFGAAKWALEHGSDVFALAVTEANTAARNLYEQIGMHEVSRYHYRIKLE